MTDNQQVADADAEAPTTARRSTNKTLLLFLIAGAQLMVVLDSTIVNIALPSMGRYFDKSQTDMTWAINAYTLAFGGLLLLGGRAADILGRRQMFILGLGLFSLGSLLGGLATSFEVLLAGRVVQGIGGAIAAPTALSLITTLFAEGRERNRAFAVYAGVSGGGAAIGLLLGGVLTEYFDWRWVLFVNVPIGVALMAGGFFYIHASERLFYTEGIRAVGVDRLCAEAEVSKRSLYQHFTGKDEVVTAMLQAKAAELASQLVTDGQSPRERILSVFAQADQVAEAPGSCGCPFVSAATELKDRDHPAVQVARAQKDALTEYFAAALRDAGVRDADLLALELTLIFDGASAYAVVRGGSTPATRQAVETLLAAHGM